MDGNFQHRHHKQAEKNHLPLQVPQLFISPEEVKACDQEILEAEVAQKKTKRGVSFSLNKILVENGL